MTSHLGTKAEILWLGWTSYRWAVAGEVDPEEFYAFVYHLAIWAVVRIIHAPDNSCGFCIGSFPMLVLVLLVLLEW